MLKCQREFVGELKKSWKLTSELDKLMLKGMELFSQGKQEGSIREQVKALTAVPEDVSSNLGTHVVKGETLYLPTDLSPSHTCARTW